MNLKYGFRVLVAGMAIFSMFFGGGNLTFPLWIGSQTSSISISALGFIVSGVLLPFLGIYITLYFNGDYEKCFSTFGHRFGQILVFVLLLFWIPLGSGPRCNQLAYGAYSYQVNHPIPMWAYSVFYSGLVFVLTLCRKRFLDVLGKIITPALIFLLLILVVSVFNNFNLKTGYLENTNWNDFYLAFIAGYNTMDFIASIFFAAAVVVIVKEKYREKFEIKFVRDACIFAIALLSVVYMGMITVGYAHTNILSEVPREQFITAIGQTILNEKFQVIIFIIITFSVLSTSMALSLVFADFLRNVVFKEKIGYKICLFISVLLSYAMSIIGFERLAILISYAMSLFYPLLLLLAVIALCKKSQAFRKI